MQNASCCSIRSNYSWRTPPKVHRFYLPVVPDHVSDRTLRFRLQQCNRSIQEIVKQASSSSMSRSDRVTTLTACILFTCFASIQRHNSQALDHLRGGLELLREYDGVAQYQPDDTQPHPIPMSSLRNMFIGLDTQHPRPRHD
jgi:hypothetical protein